MGYPSCSSFPQVKIIAHNSFSCANWNVTYFTNTCGLSSICFSTKSTVFSLLTETGRAGRWPSSKVTFAALNLSIHLQKVWYETHLVPWSNQHGFSCDRLSVSSVRAISKFCWRQTWKWAKPRDMRIAEWRQPGSVWSAEHQAVLLVRMILCDDHETVMDFHFLSLCVLIFSKICHFSRKHIETK